MKSHVNLPRNGSDDYLAMMAQNDRLIYQNMHWAKGFPNDETLNPLSCLAINHWEDIL
jgi:hypothetical protein